MQLPYPSHRELELYRREPARGERYANQVLECFRHDMAVKDCSCQAEIIWCRRKTKLGRLDRVIRFLLRKRVISAIKLAEILGKEEREIAELTRISHRELAAYGLAAGGLIFLGYRFARSEKGLTLKILWRRPEKP